MRPLLHVSPFRPVTRLRRSLLAAACLLLTLHAPAQSSSSSAPPGAGAPDSTLQQGASTSQHRSAQLETTGTSITLETSEPLFDLAVALNLCGYDADLAASSPVRQAVRTQVAAAASATPEATAARQALCTFVQQHSLTDSGRSVAQYISLSLYLSPELMPEVDESELPPDSTQVVAILPLLRTFSETIHLHAIWVEHRPEYEALIDRLHSPLQQMILNTNIYLHSPISSYDGRRFLVLLEPMLAPSAVNARIYASNYIIVVSPSAAGSFHMEQIRHTYLHYEIEPLVYARAAAMDRLVPLLRTVANAPLEFTYKSDIVALLAECLIKAIEAHTMDTGLLQPKKPTTIRQRSDMEHYDAEMSVYERQSEAVRRRAVDLSMRQGWVLTDYFYGQLTGMQRDGISLKDNIGPMVYGMDVDRERHSVEHIAFAPETTHDAIHRTAPVPTGLRLAEVKMMQGDAQAAEEIANKALADPAGDHGQANYILGRIDLLERQPEEASNHFQAAIASGKDPHTIAWSHIYLGRLYDVQPDRRKAVAEYQAALAAHDAQPDTQTAASNGIRTPFALPKREAVTPAQTDADDAPLDPTGKAEKDSYQPPK